MRYRHGTVLARVRNGRERGKRAYGNASRVWSVEWPEGLLTDVRDFFRKVR